MKRYVLVVMAMSVMCQSAFAKTHDDTAPFYQGEALTNNRYAAGYSAPAKPYLQDKYDNKYNKWVSNLILDVGFTYWYAAQDGMDIANSMDLVTTSGVNEGNVSFNRSSVSLTQSFNFSPGFQVAAGWGNEEWEMLTKYTWFRQKTQTSAAAPTNETVPGGGVMGVWSVHDWFAQGLGTDNNNVSATFLSSSWKLGLDCIDMTASRPFYQGKTTIVSPFGGVRAAWIRQTMRIRATVPLDALTVNSEVPALGLSDQPNTSHNRSSCWGLGPVFGAKTHCLLGCGFRVEGNAGLSVLFTQYTKLSHSEDSALAGNDPTVFTLKQTNYNTVRPTANVGLGLGWGRYSNNGRYHFDLSADYEFNVWWNQNMLRSFAQQFTLGTYASNDLFFHGLTASASLQF